MSSPARGRALVTGASSGLGRAYASSLADRGYLVFAVARRADRLQDLADEVVAARSGRIEPIVADLTTTSGLGICRAAVGDGVDIAVLNAGFGSLGPLAEADRRREADMVRLNCVAVTDLACDVLPGMVERGRGALIVVSSAAADQPIPFMATYAASKAFELHLVEAVAEELRGTGVKAIAVCPGPVHTEFGQQAGAGVIDGPIPHSSIGSVVERTWKALAHGRSRVGVGPIARLTRLARPLPRIVPIGVAGYIHRRREQR